jgi:uncharacterized cupin superfamily protein
VGYATVDASTVTPAPGPHPAASPHDKGIGAELGIRGFGVYQVELPPCGRSVQHDHIGDSAEDLFAVIGGSGSVVVDGEDVPVWPGVFVAVTPESTRYVQAGEGGLVYIAVCAPRSGP